MKSIKLKMLESLTSELNSLDEIMQSFEAVLKGANRYAILFNPEKISRYSVKEKFKEEYGEWVELRDGCRNGCYGSSTGEIESGFTVWIDSDLFDSRFIDEEYDEIINIEKLCNEFGDLTEIEPDSLRESMEALGIEGKADNTYNYLGHSEDTPYALCDANFEIFERGEDAPVLVIVKFHCGGDPRGNYTSEVVYKFSDVWQTYEVFSPSLQLLDQENIEEIGRLKQLIQCEPVDVELLKQELNELIGA